MLTSRLNPSVSYKEERTLRKEDVGNVSSSYETDQFNTTFLVALGKRTEEQGIAFYPVYLLHNDKFVSRIAILEVEKSKSILDEDGDVDLNKCPEFLYFSFVDESYLNTYAYESDTPTTDDDDDDPPPSDDDDDDDVSSEDGDEPWISTFMGSPDYDLLDNEGGGDCFFATIRDAYEGLGKTITVKELRQLLSDNATMDVYENYNVLYTSFVETIQSADQERKKLKAKNVQLRKEITAAKKNRAKYGHKVKEAKSNVQKHKELTYDIQSTRELLSEYMFMKNVKNFDQFKAALRKSSYWADTWAISTLERELNIKIIILSSEYYHDGDYENVMLCGQANDDAIEKAGQFTPDLYMIVDHLGNHYRLITYKDTRMFDFTHLPDDIKEIIKIRCLERMGGVYSYIPDFKIYADLSSSQVAPDDQGAPAPAPPPAPELLADEVSKPLFDDDEGTTFVFFERSSSKPPPGKGSGETIKNKNIMKYQELKEITDWRKMLSTRFPAPSSIDGLSWLTVEHYVQANKIKTSDPAAYKRLSLDSKSAASNDPSKIDDVLTEKIRPVDDDYDRSALLTKGFQKRVDQHELSRLALALTKRAKLKQYRYGKPAEVMNELMGVRNKITK